MSARTLRREVVAFAGAALIGVLPMSPGPAAAASGPTSAAVSSPTTTPAPSPSGTAAVAAEPQRVDRSSGRLLRRLTPAETRARRDDAGPGGGPGVHGRHPGDRGQPATRAEIGRYHVGNVMLTGRSSAGTSGPARVAARMQAAATPAATGGVRLLVSTDQEGGAVQVLGGPGLATIPSGLAQGRLRPDRLRERAAGWGRALRRAGVNMNLAPVLDTVPSPAAAALNPPIGVFDREYGYTPRGVAVHGTAFARGMADAGVVASGKHFPGLGRVRENPDVASGVTDPVTGPDDPYFGPFRTAIRAGVPAVMMSTAIYPRLDRTSPAAFSRTVVDGLLRRRARLPRRGRLRRPGQRPAGRALPVRRPRGALPRRRRRPGADRRPVHAAGHVPRRAGPDRGATPPSAGGSSRPPCGCSGSSSSAACCADSLWGIGLSSGSFVDLTVGCR